jgi:hypothetical protein
MGRRQIRRSTLLGFLLAVVVSAWMATGAMAATEPAIVGAVSNANSLSGVTAVAVSGNYAFAVSYWSGELNVIDISNPATPAVVATTAPTIGMTAATNVIVSGGYAFVTSKNRNASTTSNDDGTGNSLTILNVSNPLAPSVVGTVTSAADLFGAYAVAVSGPYAFIASQGLLGGQPASPDTSAGSFTVISLSTLAIVANIDNASLTGPLVDGLHHATSVSIAGDYAYVTAYAGERLTTINIANPTNPVVVSSLRDPVHLQSPNDVATQGSYAYVVNQACTGMDFTVLNLSDPAAPAVVGSLTDPTLLGSYRVRVRGNFAFVSANNAGAVAAIDISNPAAPRLAGAVTDPRLANVDGLAVSSTGRYVIATTPLLTSEHTVSYPPFPLQGGHTNTGTVSVIDLEPSKLAVSITPGLRSNNQTSASFGIAISDAVTTVQCSLDHAAPAPCTTPTSAFYSALALGKHTFTVLATDATGATAQATYAWTIGRGPQNSSRPKISGTAQQGHKLKVTSGKWAGRPTFKYQWERCSSKGTSCKSISKQVKTAYTVTAADVGARLVVAVTATSSIGSTTTTSAATNPVKWSSAAFANATLTGSHTSTPGISLSVPSPGSNLTLTQLAISLPKGLSFAATNQRLDSGISVKDLRGKRLAFTAALSHGKLTLTFKAPPTGLKLTVAPGLVSISGALKSSIRSGKAKSEKLSLTLDYTGKPARRGTAQFRLA